MDTVEIQRILNQDPIVRSHFLGVFPSDRIPKPLRRPYCYILNTDSSTKPGTHWVAVYGDARVEFFCSYGKPPHYYALPLQVDDSNIESIQPINTPTCGVHAIFFLKQRARGRSLPYITKYIYKPGYGTLNDCIALLGVFQ